MPRIQIIPATEKQINYINILVIDLSFTLKERNFFMSRIAKRNIKVPDELSKYEASDVITQFKEWKERDFVPSPLQDSVEFDDFDADVPF